MSRAVLILAALALTACGKPPEGSISANAATDKCFGLTGTWTNGNDHLQFTDSPYFAYCEANSTKCQSSFDVPKKNADGSFALSLYQGNFANEQAPSPECPGEQVTYESNGGHTSCRFDVSGAHLTMDCGNGSVVYAKQ